MNPSKDYRTIADLLTEDSFLAWRLKKNTPHEQAWEKWMAAKPANAELVKEAGMVLTILINLETQPLSVYQRNASFNRLLKKLAEERKNAMICQGC